MVKIGTAKFNGATTHSSLAIRLYLPKEQTVFHQSPKSPRVGGPYLSGEIIEDKSTFRGVIESTAGSDILPVMLDFVPWENIGDQHATVFSDGKFLVDPIWLN